MAVHDLELHQMDVKTAFLNRELNEDIYIYVWIYIEQPEGFSDKNHSSYVASGRKVCMDQNKLLVSKMLKSTTFYAMS